MKLSFLFGLSLLLTSFTTYAQQGWFWQNPLPQGNALRAVQFMDQNSGWAVGDDGTILRTTDGGTNWCSQSSGTGNDLYGVSFTNTNNGTAVGGGGIILRTTNGGTTWTQQTIYGVSSLQMQIMVRLLVVRAQSSEPQMAEQPGLHNQSDQDTV